MYLLLFLSDTKEILFICSSKFFTFSTPIILIVSTNVSYAFLFCIVFPSGKITLRLVFLFLVWGEIEYFFSTPESNSWGIAKLLFLVGFTTNGVLGVYSTTSNNSLCIWLMIGEIASLRVGMISFIINSSSKRFISSIV